MARNMNFKPNKNGTPPPKRKAKKGTLKRLLGMLFKENKKLLIVAFSCLIVSAITGVASSVFLKALLKQIDIGLSNGLSAVIGSLITIFVTMGAV